MGSLGVASCLLLQLAGASPRLATTGELGPPAELLSVEFFPSQPPQQTPPAPRPPAPPRRPARPTRRTRRRGYEGQPRMGSSSMWTEWSRRPGTRTVGGSKPRRRTKTEAPTRITEAPRRSGGPESILVFPCDEVAMRCEHWPGDGDYPLRCSWARLAEEPK
jgi:hypothetical protein